MVPSSTANCLSPPQPSFATDPFCEIGMEIKLLKKPVWATIMYFINNFNYSGQINLK